MDKKKLKYIGLCLIAPGAPQFAMRRWVRGVILLGGALLTFFWALIEVIYPMFLNISRLLQGTGEPIQMIDFLRVAAAILVLVFLWGLSFIDIFIGGSSSVDKAENTEIENHVD